MYNFRIIIFQKQLTISHTFIRIDYFKIQSPNPSNSLLDCLTNVKLYYCQRCSTILFKTYILLAGISPFPSLTTLLFPTHHLDSSLSVY